MTVFCFPLPRFSHFHRSQRPHSSPASPRNDTPASHSPNPGPLPVFSSRPSPTCGAPEQALPAATFTSCSPVHDNLTHPQNSTGRLGVGRAPGDFRGQSSRVSLPIIPIDGINSNFAPKFGPEDSVAHPPAHLVHLPDSVGSTQSELPLSPQHSSCSFGTPSQQPLVLERQIQPSDKYSLKQRYQNLGMFYQAHNLAATGNFIDGDVSNVVYISSPSNQFMKDLLKETIPGAASDSSARYPPPRCHPGTRLVILERCLYFITHCNGVKKMRWVVGAAGVGKSAIMQNVAESPNLPVTFNVSVFFSINGRNDGTKVITTLSYQIAAKSKLYRQVIENEITDDPSLQSSMPVQFDKFIVQPFIHNPALNSAGRLLIIIDGLDECSDTSTQVDLLGLITSFCITYPTSPIIWLVASRPEPHITSFFSRPEVMVTYEKEEIVVDSDEARTDVERFLRHSLTEIGRTSDSLNRDWPDEQDFWKLANAAGGLFAYAQTVIRYVGDSTVGDPVLQLYDVLDVIDEHPMHDVPPEKHPMALLDALYARILSNIPPKIMTIARLLLLALASNWDWALDLSDTSRNLVVLCNWLSLTADEAYAALNRLRSVLYFPQRDEAHEEAPRPFHKSFIDHIFRAGFSPNVKLEARQARIKSTFRVLKEAPRGIDFGDVNYNSRYGVLARNSGTDNKILLTWAVNDDKTKLTMYKLAIGEVVAGMNRGDPLFQSKFCIGLLTTQFREYYNIFPYCKLCDLVFDKSRRRDFRDCGILKQIPAKAVDIFALSSVYNVKMHFHRPVTTAPVSDPWNSSCSHERAGHCERGKEQDWTTIFHPAGCGFCFERLKRQLKSLIIRSPGQPVQIMPTSAEIKPDSVGTCCVELQLVDLEDHVSEWTYYIWLVLPIKRRRELG